MRRVRVRLSGRVQGVFFRASCAQLAEELGLSGWVRNVRGGGLEASFEGIDPAVERMLSWCREGPPLAHVERFETVDEIPTGESGFRITH